VAHTDMRKPRVCFVSESKATYGLLTGGDMSNTVGGAEVQQTLLAPALQKLGYSVVFLVPDLGQPDEVVTDQGITVIKTREQYKSSTGARRYMQDVGLLFRAMRRADADIYYQMTSATITGIIALYCRLKRKPFVFSIASNMDLDGTTRRQLKPLYHKLYWYGLTRATAIVVQTEDQMRLLKENVGRDGVLILSTFSAPDESEQQEERRYVLWVGSFRDVRRPEMFIELASRLPQYEFVMVGGPWTSQESVFDEMKARAERVPNVHLTGGVPYREVGKYFAGAKVFVNTSSMEGFPNTYMQAWCRGVPVIATFDADTLISRYGLGKSCANLDELTAGVESFMEDDALRGAIGEAAARYVREHHGVEAIAAQFDKLFTQLWRK
jgi:glycosyltransferase involved in cell wall biosynthesis